MKRTLIGKNELMDLLLVYSLSSFVGGEFDWAWGLSGC